MLDLLTVQGSALGKKHGEYTGYTGTHGMPDWPESLLLKEDLPQALAGNLYALITQRNISTINHLLFLYCLF